MSGVLRPGAYDPDDLPVVPRGSREVVAPKSKRKELNTGKHLEVPTVVGATSSSLPHAVPADVPQSYSVQRRFGPSESFGGDNIRGAPTVGSGATAFQLGIAAAGLWLVATKLGK
jgi:hypothetical protein